MQMSRGVDFKDETDPDKYQALDSLVLKKTKSGQKRSMKKLALLNIKDHMEAVEDLRRKDTSEQKFMERHPEFGVNDDEENNENEEKEEENTHEEHKDKDYWQIIEDYTVQEEKIWDCYQLFCKLINYKYNPYDDQELEDYLALQEIDGKKELEEGQKGCSPGGSMWPFGD